MSKATRERLTSPGNISKVPEGATWNNLRRLWMLDGVPVDPQPAAPGVRLADVETPWSRGFNGPRAVVVGVVPPAVKVQA